MFARAMELDTRHLSQLIAEAAWQRPAQIFIANQAHAEITRVDRGDGEVPAGRFWARMTADGPTFTAWFGNNRVACIGPGNAEHAAALRRVALGSERGFRIMIGPREETQSFLAAIRDRVRVDFERSQAFLVVEDARLLGSGLHARTATPADVEWLVDASLSLNEEDLHLARHKVDRTLLTRRVYERSMAGASWIADEDGHPVCKLEVGSTGPAGALIEGVYTEAAHRGRGLARRLVATVAAELLATSKKVGLHVGRDNVAARAAYHAAGFREVDDLWIALLNWDRR